MIKYVIRAYDGNVNAKTFHCGQVELNEYIGRYASQDIKRNLARVFVASPEDKLACLSGFLP